MLASLAAGLSGCTDMDSEFFPLHTGWTYEYVVERETMDGPSELRYYLQHLPRTELDGNSVWPRRTLSGKTIFYARKNSGIWRVASVQQDFDSGPEVEATPVPDERLVLPAELALGSTWQAESSTAVLEKTGPPQATLYRVTAPLLMTYAVVSTDSDVEVPAGRFRNCIVVRGEGKTNIDAGNYVGQAEIVVETEDWYAPGFGLVRSIRTERTSKEALNFGSMTMELRTRAST